MAKFQRGDKGKFVAKSSEHRLVRSLRLTDSAWDVLGQQADSRCITRADLIEYWVSQKIWEPTQLALPMEKLKPPITSGTRLSGVELARRLNVSSAAFTPVLKQGDSVFAEYTKQRDPDRIAWVRDGKKYRPLL